MYILLSNCDKSNYIFLPTFNYQFLQYFNGNNYNIINIFLKICFFYILLFKKSA